MVYPRAVIPNEVRDLLFYTCHNLGYNEKQIPRYARNDSIGIQRFEKWFNF